MSGFYVCLLFNISTVLQNCSSLGVVNPKNKSDRKLWIPFYIYYDNELLWYMHRNTVYNNIAYNKNNNSCFSETKILMYYFHVSFMFLPLIISSSNVNMQL